MIFSKAIILIILCSPLSKYNMHWHKVNLIFLIPAKVQKPMTKQGVEHVLSGSPSLPVNCTMQLCQSGLGDIAPLTVLWRSLIAGRPNAVPGIHFQYVLFLSMVSHVHISVMNN